MRSKRPTLEWRTTRPCVIFGFAGELRTTPPLPGTGSTERFLPRTEADLPRSHGPPWECRPRPSASLRAEEMRPQSDQDGIPTEDRGNEELPPVPPNCLPGEVVCFRPIDKTGARAGATILAQMNHYPLKSSEALIHEDASSRLDARDAFSSPDGSPSESLRAVR